MTRKNDVLLTGATGLIGGEIAALLSGTGYRVWALVRAKNQIDAAQRIAARFERSSYSVPSTLIPVCGDITQESLGIRDRRILRLIRRNCGEIVHAAGATSFKDGHSCYATNVRGASEIIQETKTWTNEVRLFYLSTSFVCCSPRDSEIAEDMPCSGYANAYIDSKRIVERQFSSSHLNAVIMRPSIVVSRGIRDRQFARSILWFLPVIAKLGMVPVNRTCRIDIVPVDYVAKCVAETLKRNIRSGCYNVSTGSVLSVTIGEVVEIMFRHTGEAVTFVSNRDWNNAKRRVTKRQYQLMRAVEYYTPFINLSIVYSRAKIRAVLGADMPECPPFSEYCESFLDLIPYDAAVLESENP